MSTDELGQQDEPEEKLYTAYMDGSLVLGARGDWSHNGQPFTHQGLIRFFHRSVQWNEEEQKYYIVYGKGRSTFSVEDTAEFVTQVNDQQSPWTIRLASGREEGLDPLKLLIGSEDQLYLQLQNGQRARFIRGAYQMLVARAVSDSEIDIAGKRYTVKKIHE